MQKRLCLSTTVSAVTHSDEYNIDKAVDYVMMDNEDFYAYLAGE